MGIRFNLDSLLKERVKLQNKVTTLQRRLSGAKEDVAVMERTIALIRVEESEDDPDEIIASWVEL